jgi:hypothetical protein
VNHAAVEGAEMEFPDGARLSERFTPLLSMRGR